MKHSPEQLIATTQAVLTRRRLATVLSAGIASCIIAAVAIFFADAIIALPTALRQPALPLWMLAIAGALIVPWLLIRWLQPSPAESVSATEQACDDQLRTLTTALALQKMPGELAQLGATRLANQLDASQLLARLPTARVGRWILMIVFALITMACVQMVMPRLTSMVMPRFTDPAGDHPPFSLTQVAWAQLPERVRVGDSARFEATIDGPGINRGMVLCAQYSGTNNVVRLPMFQVGSGRFAGELSSVQQPATVWVEGGGTRTHYRQLAVDLVPILSKLELAVDAPVYARLETER
jgi:muconolactone delta-isomerase